MAARPFRPAARTFLSLALLALGALAGCGGRAADAPFAHDVSGPVRPWTNESFRSDPGGLRFAVISDRCGGERKGVFPAAIEKVNLLQPEFVLCVGDLIEGYTEDPAKLDAQHAELDAMLAKVDAPFFFLPGNHDVTNAAMVAQWERRRGRRHYSFVYKDVLFVILDSQDGPRGKNGATSPGLSEAQVAWATDAIARHPDVRWTFVLMHQPLWVYEEGGLASARKKAMKPIATGFPQIESALADRDYTVLAGHYHQYIHGTRHGRNYIILASTGGSSQVRGVAEGEFDHILWVALGPAGAPRLANLLLDGILPEDVHTEAGLRFSQGLAFEGDKTVRPDATMSFTLPLANPFDHDLAGQLSWDLPPDTAWAVTPAKADIRLAAHQSEPLSFTARAGATGRLFPLPTCRLRLTAGSQAWQSTLPLPMDVDAYLRDHRPTLTARKARAKIAIDGKLDDDAWTPAPDVAPEAFQAFLLDGDPTVGTQAWVAWDEQYYYLAFRCDEPRMDLLASAERPRDDAVWDDDCIDVMIAPDAAQPKAYYQFIVNPSRAVYDSKGMDKAFNAAVQTAAERGPAGWTIELAIPWADLGAAPAAGAKMTFLLSRARPQRAADRRQILQYPALNAWNHRWEHHGHLILGE